MEKEMLYRYMSFSEFVSIVQEEELTLVSPIVFWEDAYEGLPFKALETEKGKEVIRQFSKKYKYKISLEDIIRESKNVLCQSWTKKKDEHIMWQQYSYGGQALMIEVEREKLDPYVHLTDIEYRDNDYTLEKILEEMCDNEGVFVYKVYGQKRKMYDYEDEVRAFVKSKRCELRGKCRIDVKQVIKGVMVHPAASEKFANIVKEFCEEKDISFIGKSKLYNWKDTLK